MRHPRANRARQGQGGFTIVETAIALLILMIVGLGAASFVLFSLRNNTGAGVRAGALAVGQQQMEELRAVTFDNVESAVTAGGGSSKTVTVAGQQYTVATSVTYSPSSTSPTLKTVTIDVTPVATSQPGWIGTGVRFVTTRATQKTGSYSK
ncbi:MAG: prepilin-type N-terminal cleavage/methylation domain-containing protein [Acidobacteriota bacterium]|nr:prepilin-type N-terminal cleavage/methylation domain-containing protein [Acidobacteriota bacterium]